jgi:hypothetical protein
VKASVLSMILGMFQIDRFEIDSEGDADETVSSDTRCYTLLVPVVEGGLKAAAILEIGDEEKGSGSLQIQNALQETVWERMIASFGCCPCQWHPPCEKSCMFEFHSHKYLQSKRSATYCSLLRSNYDLPFLLQRLVPLRTRESRVMFDSDVSSRKLLLIRI